MVFNSFYRGRALRIAVGITMMAFLLVGGVGAVSMPDTSSPWPMIFHDPQHTARSEFLGAQTNNTELLIPLQNGRGSPLINNNGTIYIGKGSGIPWASEIYAFNKNGSLRWNYTIVKDPNCTRGSSSYYFRWGYLCNS
jgi:hypothetical protein